MSLMRLILVTILVLTTLGVLGIRSFQQPARAVQPVRFSHRLHVEDLAMECTACHAQVTIGAHATLPTVYTCMVCHTDPLTETDTEAKLLAYTTDETEILWQRVYWVPDHVYFSHRRHVTLGNIPCESCHGDVATMSEPFDHPLVPVTMDGCMECHEQHRVTNDCLSCHR